MRSIKVKKVMLAVFAAVFMAGCGNNNNNDIYTDTDNSINSNNNLDFERATISESNEGISPYEDYEANKEFSIWIDPYSNFDEIIEAYEAGEEIYSFKENVTYTGERLNYRLYINNASSIPIQETYFMTANGNMQPFYADNSEELYCYTVTVAPGEKKDVMLSFDPIYAPLDTKGITKIYSYSYPAKVDELTSIMSCNKTDFTAPYIYFKGYGCSEVYIQADSAENERKVNPYKNEMGEDSPSTFTDKSTGVPENAATGVTFGDEFTNDTLDGLIGFNLEWNPQDTLYARAHCYGEEDVRVFLLMDGELVPAFNGQYFADYYQKTGVVHNIPLYSEALPKDGEHIIVGFIDYVNEDETDALYPILIQMQ